MKYRKPAELEIARRRRVKNGVHFLAGK